MTTTAEPLADQGPCRTCDCVQWDHKRGKGCCKACGTCDKYEPPKVHPKSAPARALAELTRESIELGTYDLAVPADEPPAGPQPADDLARVTLPAAEVDQLRVERDKAQAEAQDAAYAARKAREAVQQLARERTEAELQRDQAYERVDELTDELGRIHAALGIELDRDAVEVIEDAQRRVEQLAGDLANAQATTARLAADVARANAAQARAQRQLDEAIRASVTAAANVLWRYDARQCETCGRRFTADVDHEHPLTPVTVLVVRRDVPGATEKARADALAQMKENNE